MTRRSRQVDRNHGAGACRGRSDESMPRPRLSPFHLWLFRGAFVALLAAYDGAFFIAARSLQGHFGFSIGWWLQALAATAVMTLFVLPLAVFARLPQHWVEQHRPASRWRRGLCPHCGHAWRGGRDPGGSLHEPGQRPRSDAAPPAICPECGAEPRAPSYVELSSASFRAFGAMALVALLLGAVLGELLVQLDEWRFRGEVAREMERGAPTAFERRRQWPGGFATLRWTPEHGIGDHADDARAPR